jgi:flagellar biosynthetic protein FliQ
MDASMVIDIGRQALWVTLIVSGPIMIVGLIVGLLVGIFQAVTQIHEMTLTFIPKILSMVIVFIILMPWMLLKIIEYTVSLFELIGKIGK